jgi:RHS repeat-associated protein
VLRYASYACDSESGLYSSAFAAYRYDAWGLPQGAGTYATGIWTQGTPLVNATLAGEIAARQILRYASYAYDSESGLYYCSARYYDPATRQWTTGDPAKADGEESAYQYCGGEPVARTDSSGKYAVKLVFPPYRTNLPDYTAYFKRVLRLNAGMAWKNCLLNIPQGGWGVVKHCLWFYNKEKRKGQWDFKTAPLHVRTWTRSTSPSTTSAFRQRTSAISTSGTQAGGLASRNQFCSPSGHGMQAA